MEYAKYKVTYSVKDSLFDGLWDYYMVEATSTKQAIALAKELYTKEISNKYLNRAPIKLVKFVALKRSY